MAKCFSKKDPKVGEKVKINAVEYGNKDDIAFEADVVARLMIEDLKYYVVGFNGCVEIYPSMSVEKLND